MALLALAAKQHDTVSRAQLTELGFGAAAITYRLTTGRLHRVHAGVYAVGRPSLTRHGRWMAATLACGIAAALSHRAAAALWQIYPFHGAVIDVSAPGRSRNARPGLRVHRPRRLEPEDVTTVDGIPVTTVARTLIDLAPSLSPQRFERAWDAGVRLGVLDLDEVIDLRARSNGRRGLHKVDALIVAQRPLPPRSRTELERDGYDLFANAPGIPIPSANAWLPEVAMEVDLVWPGHGLVVELDHQEWHAKTRAQRERDTARDVSLQLADYMVLRVSDFRLRTDGPRIVEDARNMLEALARRSARA
jgi:hypothetical protein